VASTLSQILRRFRPAVAPGPAGPAGVPADRGAEAEAELAAVFAALEPSVADARRVREEARADAGRRRRHGLEEAERIVAEARNRLDAVRAEAASAQLAALDAERATLEGNARAEVDRVERLAEARVPDLVAQVVARVRMTGGPLPGPPSETPSETRSEAGRSEVAG